MGIQCHTRLKHIIKHATTVTINRIENISGGGPEQDQPWSYLLCDALLNNGALLYFNMSDDLNDLWFDANHWGDNRWQVEEMRRVGIPYSES